MAMDLVTRARLEARALVIKALAHPTRLFIVEELSRGERCVCELTEMIGADVSTVSKHLSVLKNAGIVQDEKRRSQVIYSLRVPCVLNFFGCVEAVLESTARDAMQTVSVSESEAEQRELEIGMEKAGSSGGSIPARVLAAGQLATVQQRRI